MDQLSQYAGSSVEHAVAVVLRLLSKIPGSAIVGRYIVASHQNDPARTVFEALLALFALHYFLRSKQSYGKRDYVPLSTEETDELIKEWSPEPLVDKFAPQDEAILEEVPVLTSSNKAMVTIEGTGDKPLVNLASTDLYSFSFDRDITDVGVDKLLHYGVGSCGPAGFYGNEDVHTACERDIAEFLGTESCILYSQGFSTATSVIPCFAKRGDVLVVDEAINMSCQRGIQLSRAKVLWYAHNDMEDLERQLVKARRSYRGRGPLPRRFIVTEGLFEYTANSPDLHAIVELKRRYKFRLLLDESWSLGVLGKHGRGLPEEQGVNRKDVDITVGSLATCVGMYGGFCAGEKHMVEHQRIVSLAYTFSATEPPYLAACTSAVVKRMAREDFAPRIAGLRERARVLFGILNKSPQVEVLSHFNCPIIVFQIKDHRSDALLNDIVRRCRDQGLMVTRLRQIAEYEMFAPVQAIRLYLPESLNLSQIKTAGDTIVKSVKAALKANPHAT